MTLRWKEFGEAGPFGLDVIPGMDPAANWLLGPGKGAFLAKGKPGQEDAVIPCLVIVDTTALEDPPVELLPPWLPDLLDPKVSLRVETKLIPISELSEYASRVREEPEAGKALRLLRHGLSLSPPHSETAFPEQPVEPELSDPPPPTIPDDGWPEETVVMAVIDDGLCFAHEAFRDAAGQTRIQYWWRQDGKEPDDNLTVEFGQEIGKNDAYGRPGIDSLLEHARVPGGVDETQVYRAAGLVDFSKPGRSTAALSRTHGTHVLDVAAGYDPAQDEKTRPIIAVQLPAEVVEQSSGAELEFHVTKAIDYIMARAVTLAGGGRQLPVVINMSYGFIAGPHDGTTELEVALDQRLEDYGDRAQMVLSAGNSHLSRCHAEFVFEENKDKDVTLEWHVLPDDRTSSFLEIWLPYDSTIEPDPCTGHYVDKRIKVSVTAPGGIESGFVDAERVYTRRLVRNGSIEDQDVAAEIKYAYVAGETQRGVFRITLAPTAHLAGEPGPWAGHALAPPGVWRVHVRRDELAAGLQVNAWVQRDDTIYGYPSRGRQSFLVNTCYRRFDDQGRPIVEDEGANQGCAIRRRALVSAVATGKRVIVAGAYRLREQEAADYSAGEPITPARGEPSDPCHRKPDALMISEGSRVHRGVLAAGGRSGSVKPMGGTSVAAPGLARWLAKRLAPAGADGRETVMEGALYDEGPGGPFEHAPDLNRERGGWGRIASERRRVDPLRFDD